MKPKNEFDANTFLRKHYKIENTKDTSHKRLYTKANIKVSKVLYALYKAGTNGISRNELLGGEQPISIESTIIRYVNSGLVKRLYPKYSRNQVYVLTDKGRKYVQEQKIPK